MGRWCAVPPQNQLGRTYYDGEGIIRVQFCSAVFLFLHIHVLENYLPSQDSTCSAPSLPAPEKQFAMTSPEFPQMVFPP